VTVVSSISLSAAAAARVATIARRQGRGSPKLRLLVDGGGCAGFQYRFELADAPADDDLEVTTDGVGLLVDSVSLPFVEGAVVDYIENLGGAAFQVRNPNAQSSCGCGTSFSV
jgi:iron-sulfur cluster assembly accessory protein